MKSRLILALFTLFLPLPAVFAMINPQEYQDEAPDKATIEVLSVWLETGKDRTLRTALVARVKSVERSKAGLSAGDIVLIAYTADSAEIEKSRKRHAEEMKGMVGPQFLEPPSPPKPGAVLVAYLAPNEDGKPETRVFKPGAHQYSFESAP